MKIVNLLFSRMIIILDALVEEKTAFAQRAASIEEKRLESIRISERSAHDIRAALDQEKYHSKPTNT